MKIIRTQTVAEARSALRRMLRGGTKCPVCDRYAKMYRRQINSGMAMSLIAMYKINPTGWIHLPSQIDARSREEGKLAYWGLVEEMTEKREDGGRAGYWRLTYKGRRFVRGQLDVQKFAMVYNQRCYGFEGDYVGIRDCLAAKFDYDEVMSG